MGRSPFLRPWAGQQGTWSLFLISSLCLFPHSSPKPILAEGLPACPGAPSLDLRERLRNKMAGKSKRLYLSSSWILYSSFNSRLTRCGKEPQNTDRSQCSGGDSPCLPTAASPFSSCREKGWHQATASLYRASWSSGPTLPPAGWERCCQAPRQNQAAWWEQRAATNRS